MKFRLYLFIAAILASNFSYSQDWKVFPYKPTGSLISFPTDEGRHTSQPVEWWYTAGHLTGNTSGKTYSYMLTYFYYPVLNFDGFRILNLTDDATGKFYQDATPVNYSAVATNHLDIQATVYKQGNEIWSNKTDSNNKLIPFQYTIQAASSNVALNLNYNSLKRPLILADSGYLAQGLNNYTFYYSQTRNDVSGKLTLNGVSEDVTGTSWIDRQYGNFNPWTGEKYEWFHAQLSNGMDMNFWNIFTEQNTIPKNSRYCILSAYVNDSTQYTVSDFKMERLGYNRTPDSVMCYADKWRLTSGKNKIDLTITTKEKNSEVTWPFRFFEGATSITGTVNGSAVTGFGFAELLHSYQNPEIDIKNPNGGIYKTSAPVSWQLINPDDGNPVTYNVEYSIDDKATFRSIAQGITDTFYQCKNSIVKNGDKIWFKITAISVDGKLQGTAISKSASTVTVAETANQEIKLFPNPADGNLFIEPAFQMDNPVCKIIDVNGRVLYTLKSNSISNKIDVNYLPPGVYFLKIGARKDVLKFLKK
jgi:predicted secreted hydrolase